MDETFIKDLDELDEGNDMELEQQGQEDDDNEDQEEMKDEENEKAIGEFKAEFKHEVKDVSNLINDKDFVAHMDKISKLSGIKLTKTLSIEDEEYHLILKSNEYAAILDREIAAVHKFIKDLYFNKFSELEQIVLNPIDYVKCIKLIQNEIDLNKVDLSMLLTNHQIVAVNVASSSTIGKPLSQNDLEKVLKTCDIILNLDESQRKLLLYIESRMKFISPNLSALVGTTCASKLMACAGGIEALAKMPACNIQVMGSQKKALLGFSKAGQGFHRGFFGTLDFVKKAPTQFQTRLVRMLSTNVAKCARVDFLRTCPSGSAGEKLKTLMLSRFDKIQEPPTPKTNKPLPVPDDKPKKRRGGKKFRKMKERLQLTDVRKYRNRLKFGDEEEQEFRETGIGFGMLSSSQGIGKVKLNVNKNQKLKLSKKQQQRLVPFKSSDSNDVTSGLHSSLAFTPVQGMELINPSLLHKDQKDGTKTENYFKKESGFRTVLEEKKKGKQELFQSLLGGGFGQNTN